VVWLAYAEHLLLNAARLWVDANLDQKQRLQRVIFPNGVEFLDGEVLTSGTASLFNTLREIDLPIEHLASPTVPSWNRVVTWLREVDSFRQMAA
jgi:hypothetical protein